MKKFISILISCILMFSLTISVGAYDKAGDRWYGLFDYTFKWSSAVQWDGKTAFKENTYYYTTRTVTVSKDFTLPANSTLEVRKPLKITQNAELKILGELLVNYGGKVNPLSGTLTVAQSGGVDCFGGISVSKNGILNVDGSVFVYEAGSFAAKGRVSVSESGKIACGGSYKEYSGCEVTGAVFKPTNITDSLSEKLSELSDSDKLRVDFLFYDSDTMRGVTLDGTDMLDIQFRIQNDYLIPYNMAWYFSRYLSDYPGYLVKGSYKQLKNMLLQKTSPELRYIETNYGSVAKFENYLSNPFFSNIEKNPAYANTHTEVPSDNKYLISEDYKKMLESQWQLAENLNTAFLQQLSDSFNIEELSERNTALYGFGRFSGIMSKSDIMSLNGDKRFLFICVNDGSGYIDGKDKLDYHLEDIKYHLESDGWASLSVHTKLLPYGSVNSDEAYRMIADYTKIIWDVTNYGECYDASAAGTDSVSLFARFRNGIYSFHGFYDDVKSINADVNLDLFNSYSTGCTFYHMVRITSIDELKALAADDEILYINDGYISNY